MRSTKILLAHNRYLIGGGERQVFEAELGLLRDNGHEVEVYIEDNQRVLDLGPELSAGDEAALSDLFAASYTGARDLFEIGAPAREAMIKAMQKAPGVVAARQAGAGFGGCMVAIVEANSMSEFRDSVSRSYHRSTGLTPEVYPVQAADGAGVLKIA